MTSNVDNLLSVAASSLYSKIHDKLWVTLNQVWHYPPLNWKSKLKWKFWLWFFNFSKFAMTFVKYLLANFLFHFNSPLGSGSKRSLMRTWIRIRIIMYSRYADFTNIVSFLGDKSDWLWHLLLQSGPHLWPIRGGRLAVELQLLLLQQEDEEDCPLHLPRPLALQPGNREHGTNWENCCCGLGGSAVKLDLYLYRYRYVFSFGKNYPWWHVRQIRIWGSA